MSNFKGEVGARKIEWTEIRGSVAEGSGAVVVDGQSYRLSWKKDADGFWLELPEGVKGFDVFGERDDVEGLQFRVQERGGDRFWDGLRFKRAGEAAVAGTGAAKRAVRVRAQMPGKIVRILVAEGAEVAKDQPLLVMEAMKMENEIRAPAAGKIGTIQVVDGQAVETGADLILMA